MTPTVSIEQRKRLLINTDPQRRCYNGAYASSELVWTPWEHFVTESTTVVHEKLTFWKELNDYAVNCRGESARCEYRIKP